jgi:hypothetical protein
VTQFIFTNDAKSTLAVGISASDTSIQLSLGTGALFPSPGAGQQFPLTLADVATGTVKEIVYCTSRTGDVLTVVRAQEGTIANAYIAGSFANLFITAGTAAAFSQGAVAPAGGNTASRPSLPKLFQYYFDTTLGIPIWCNQITPTVTWVAASGASV